MSKRFERGDTWSQFIHYLVNRPRGSQRILQPTHYFHYSLIKNQILSLRHSGRLPMSVWLFPSRKSSIVLWGGKRIFTAIRSCSFLPGEHTNCLSKKLF